MYLRNSSAVDLHADLILPKILFQAGTEARLLQLMLGSLVIEICDLLVIWDFNITSANLSAV